MSCLHGKGIKDFPYSKTQCKTRHFYPNHIDSMFDLLFYIDILYVILCVFLKICVFLYIYVLYIIYTLYVMLFYILNIYICYICVCVYICTYTYRERVRERDWKDIHQNAIIGNLQVVRL